MISVRALANLTRMGLLPLAERVAAEHRVTVAAMVGRDRHKSPAAARHHLWLLLRHTFPGLSYPEIASIFDVDHSTVLDAVHRLEHALDAQYAGQP